ncbi:6542_t:CDS:2, partial [Acaulospora colombiana]
PTSPTDASETASKIGDETKSKAEGKTEDGIKSRDLTEIKADVTKVESEDMTAINARVTKFESKDSSKNEDETENVLEQLRGIMSAYDPFGPRYDSKGFEELLLNHFIDAKLDDTVNDAEHKDLLMRDVVRASAAAPTYFRAKEIGAKYYIDGGVFMNNPTLRAYIEARKRFPNTKFVVLSLGTGFYQPSLEDHKDSGVVQW